MNLLKFLILSFLGVMFISLPAQAVIEIDITRGNVQPLPIAITPLIGDSDALTKVGSVLQIGEKIAQVVTADLERS